VSAAPLLQKNGLHADTAEAGLVTNQYQQAGTGEAAKNGGKDGINSGTINPARQQLAKQRQQSDGAESLERERLAKRENAENVEEDVDQEVAYAERDAAGVIGEKGEPRTAAGEQPGLPIARATGKVPESRAWASSSPL